MEPRAARQLTFHGAVVTLPAHSLDAVENGDPEALLGREPLGAQRLDRTGARRCVERRVLLDDLARGAVVVDTLLPRCSLAVQLFEPIGSLGPERSLSQRAYLD